MVSGVLLAISKMGFPGPTTTAMGWRLSGKPAAMATVSSDLLILNSKKYCITKRRSLEVPRLKIQFFNVGHGDCTFVQFPTDRNMLVDINNSKAVDEGVEEDILESVELSLKQWSLQKSISIDSIFSFARKRGVELPEPVDPIAELKGLGVSSIFRYVQTHPDMDHMSGLYRLHCQEQIPIINFWDTQNTKKQDFDESRFQRYDERDWDEYQRLRLSNTNPKALFFHRGDRLDYFQQDGITILAPTKELCEKANSTEDYNKSSYVLLLQHKGCKIVLGGDADQEVWQSIIDVQELAAMLKDVTVLKASHHGRESGFHEDAVRIMSPQYTVCSIGKKPETDAHNAYAKYTSKQVLSTRFRGNITMQVDEDGKARINWTHNR